MRTLGRSNLVWKDGRFSWPFVAIVAYLALTVFLFDYTWRVTESSIETLLMAAGAMFALGLVVLFMAVRALSRAP